MNSLHSTLHNATLHYTILHILGMRVQVFIIFIVISKNTNFEYKYIIKK